MKINTWRGTIMNIFLLFMAISSSRMAVGQSVGNMITATVDFSKLTGTIRPLHGVNDGPFDYYPKAAPIIFYFAKASFPFVRLHDVNWPYCDAVDIHAIFPIFNADPNDPQNYTFKKTDDYIAAIIKTKAKIIYRLGESIEQRARYYTYPPKDFKKWARICVNIIRHYNDGWDNGFHYNIKYWEIWNEPEDRDMWSGTMQRYFDLYKITSRAIKEYDPYLQVGGPAASRIYHHFVKPFLAYCRDSSLPLDFFSWHLYTDSLQKIVNNAQEARLLLNQYGFTNTKSFLDEWHYRDLPWSKLMPGLGIPGYLDSNLTKYSGVKDLLVEQNGPKGASFAASVLSLMQDCPVDEMNYYSADYGNMLSMFDQYGTPGKVYYVFYAFNQLVKMGNRAYSTYNNDGNINTGLSLLAALSKEKDKAAILISNFSGIPKLLDITLKHFLDANKVLLFDIYLVDKAHDLDLIRANKMDSDSSNLRFNLPPYSVYLIELTRK